MIRASACGKVILCGEHAVVYGQPALALPLTQLRADAELVSRPGPAMLHAPDLGLSLTLTPDQEHPLAVTLLSAFGHFDQPLAEIELTVRSLIPIGRGLGSGSAISAAIFRAVAKFLGMIHDRTEEESFIQQIETLYHGRPSGIDAAVVSCEKAIRFQTGRKPALLEVPAGWSLMIGDSGESAPTHVMVNGLRQRHDEAPHRYDLLFTAVGALCGKAEVALKTEAWRILGRLMNQNQRLLQEMSISTPRLDLLVQAALDAGALGAKLSGGGGGGVVIALTLDRQSAIEAAWLELGVQNIYHLAY